MSVERSALNVERSGEAGRAVFLSYAHEDAVAARRIAEALRAAGVEVWFDQSELRGGDAWDAKIRRRIRECALFVPVVSANTQARIEGYFRIEWRLAALRTHALAHGVPLLLPVVIDATSEDEALAPLEFQEVQWTRLESDDALAPFCQRVRALLNDGTRAPAATREGSRPPGTGTHSPLRARRVRRRRPLVAAALAVLALVATLIWQPWRLGPAAQDGGNTPPAAESAQLTAKARALFLEGDDLHRESYLLAEEVIKKAVAADVTDAEAWATYAQLSVEFYRYGFDRTPARIEAMRAHAERALRLAPDSINAQVAIAEASDYLGMDQAVTAAKLRALSQKVPNNWQVLHALGRKLGRAGKVDEAQTALARADELAGGNPSVWADAAAYFLASGRYAEAEIATTKSLARRSNLRALIYQAILDLCWRGDKAAAIAGVESWPTWGFNEDRGCAIAGLVWLWSRQPEKALALYQRIPRDYLNDQFFTGPRAALSALAHEQAGHREAARADWQLALQVAERRLAVAADDALALYWKAWALGRLGDKAAGGAILQQLEQRNWMPPSYFAPEAKAAGLALALGQPDAALGYLDRDITPAGAEQAAVFRNAFVNFKLTRAVLTFNPVFDELRGRPRFATLLERAPAPRGLALAALAAPPTNSVAVLAFENRSSEREGEYFSDGISEELLNLLGRMPGLRVAARTSAFAFKRKNAPLQEIGRTLNVAHIVEGSVQRSGTRALISASLSRADTGEQIWGDSFPTELKDILTAQQDIARLIAQKLSINLGSVLRSAKTVVPEAHRLVLEGRHFWYLRSRSDLAKAEALFTKAAELDPTFAQAWAGLADVCAVRATYAVQDGADYASVLPDMQRVRREALRAIELDPTIPEAHAALGYVCLLEKRYPEAEEHLQKSLALNPNYSVSHAWVGILRASQGRLDDALRAIEKAADLDPLWTINLSTLSELLFWSRHFEAGLAVTERVLALRSDVLITNLGNRARLLFALGRTDEAVETARKIRANLDKDPRRDADSSAIWVLQHAGLKADAEAYAEEMFRRLPAQSQQRGFILGALGRFEEALPFLERTPPVPRRRLFWDPMWDAWRDTPRFAQLIEKLGCAEEYQAARASLARMLRESGPKK